jgi:predicted GNAT superfamily acetyltransferase
MKKIHVMKNQEVSYCAYISSNFNFGLGTIVVVIVWELDLQLPVQSVPITINVVSSNPIQVRCTRHSIM